jgi:hypothetical protein
VQGAVFPMESHRVLFKCIYRLLFNRLQIYDVSGTPH